MDTKVKCVQCQDFYGRITHNNLPYCLYCLSQVRSKELLESKEATIVGQKVKEIRQPAADEIEIEFENGSTILLEAINPAILKLYVKGDQSDGKWVRTDTTKLNKGV